MALSRVSSFPWDSVLSKVSDPEVKKSLNVLRGKANDILANSGKYMKKPASIDFADYHKRLKFTATAVDKLEKIYSDRKLPTYNASLPAFEAKKRAALNAELQILMKASDADTSNVNAIIAEFESKRVNKITSTGELFNRFPSLAKEIETNLSKHDFNPNLSSNVKEHH